MRGKLKVLIVDDSRIFRSALEESLAGEDDIEVVGSVHNGVKALEFIAAHHPDLVTLDVEMPEMGGLETLVEIQKANAARADREGVGVIMVSSFTRKGADVTIEALEAGAFDFIAKPSGGDADGNRESFKRQLCVKLRTFASQRLARSIRAGAPPRQCASSPPAAAAAPGPVARLAAPCAYGGTGADADLGAVLIGVSTGGPRALLELMPKLCEGMEAPVLIVQHMPPTFTESLAQSLDARCRYTVLEAAHNATVKPCHAYVAPGGRHMAVRRRGDQAAIVINSQPPENGCRPAADVLFRSAAPVWGAGVVAVVLTGMGSDGTRGLGPLKRGGAYVIAQDEASSVVWGMPGSAVASGHVDAVLPLDGIADAIHAAAARARCR